MNLGIEYLIRTGTIKGFLEAPCSLFLASTNGKRGKVIHLKDTIDRPGAYLCKVWNLEETDNCNYLPVVEECLVPKNEVFVHERVILPNYRPLVYAEQPVMSSRNAYNMPMEKIDYTYFTNNYLYSGKHRAKKLDWLWDEFAHLSLREIRKSERSIDDIPYYDRRSFIEKEQYVVRNNHKSVWFRWVLWRNELLFTEKVAPELVFSTAFKS